MNIHQLEYFIAIVKAGTYSGAAKQLYLSQPALSKSIKNLEIELGTTLFMQIDKHLELTDTGRIFCEKAELLLKDYQDAISAVNEVTALQKGVLHLGVPYGLGKILLDSLISQFSKKYPYIKINISGGGSNYIRELILSGKIDIGATIIPPDLGGLFSCTTIAKDKYFLMVHATNPIAKMKEVHFSDLKKEKFVMLNEEFAMTQITRACCKSAGFSPEITMYVDRSDFMSELVGKNQGIAVIAGGRKRFEHIPDIALVDIMDDNIEFDIALITKKSTYLSQATKHFLEFSEAYFKEQRELL